MVLKKIQIVDANTLSITNYGDINSNVWNVLVSHGLAFNLLYVGQLVDNNCDVKFSRDGCLLQKQVSGEVIAKGPKMGQLFPLQFIYNHLSFACNNVLNLYEVWHRKLGHPNSTVLFHLFKASLLRNKNVLLGDSILCV